MYPPHHAGGYEVMWEAAVRRARELGHHVRVLTTDYRISSGIVDTDPEVHRTLRSYWDMHAYEFPKLSVPQRVAHERHNAHELQRHLDELRPDTVSWWSMGCVSLSLIERVHRAGIPASFVVHDDWLVYGRRFDQWIRLWRGRRMLLAPAAERLVGVATDVDLAGAGRFVFNSHYTLEAARRAGVDPPSAVVVPPGIEDGLEQLAPEPWRWRLLYIGRLDRQKGIETAIRALPHLPAEATLAVWGTGQDQYVEEMRSLARQLGVEHRVQVNGWAGPSERLAAYREADVVVFPVRWEEPFGLVPLEAMAVGRPVVTTARGGSAEFLRHEDNALVFEADDAARLAELVRRLAADQALRDRLRAGGLQTASRYTLRRFADDTVGEMVAAAGP
jgi:glycogen synthase